MIFFYMKTGYGIEMNITRQMLLSDAKGEIFAFMSTPEGFPLDRSIADFHDGTVMELEFMYSAIQIIIYMYILEKYSISIKNLRVEFPEWIF